MDISIQKHKTQAFFPWFLDNIHSMQTKLWAQIGMWLIIASALAFWSQN